MFGSNTITTALSQDNCFDLNICPDLIMAILAAGAAAGFLALYMALTMAAGGKRRRKRGLDTATDTQQQALFWLGSIRKSDTTHLHRSIFLHQSAVELA